MNENKAVPNIRFKSFENYWVKIKVSNLGNKFTGGGTPSKKNKSYWSGSIPWFQSSDLILNNVLKISIKKRITCKAIDESSTKLVSKDSIAIVTRVGVGKLVLIPYKYTTSQDFISISEIIYNKKFVLYLLYYVLNYSRRLGTKQGTSIKGITKNYFLTTEVVLSKNSFEQQKIGDFFTKLDKLLDLQQQKINKLELLKKALLQKLFPKHDAKIPELRFQGFNDEWKKEKLSKFGHTFSGLSGKTKKDFGHGKAKYITYMNVFKNPLTSKTELDDIEVDSKQHAVKYGDVLFTMSSETPDEVGMSSVWKYHLENIYLNSFSFGYRHSTKFDLNFLAFMFRSQVVREQIKILAQGISRYNISKNKMMDILAYFPTESEQQKIGNLLSKVDQLIKLENKKLQNFQQLKKCLLQNMFVE